VSSSLGARGGDPFAGGGPAGMLFRVFLGFGAVMIVVLFLPVALVGGLGTKVDAQGRRVPLWKRLLRTLGTLAYLLLFLGMCITPWLSGRWLWLGIGWPLIGVVTVILFVGFVSILIFDSLFRPSSGLLAKWHREAQEEKSEPSNVVVELTLPDPVTSGANTLLETFMFKRGCVAVFPVFGAVVTFTALSTIWEVAVGIGMLIGLTVWIAALLVGLLDGLSNGRTDEVWESVGFLALTAVGVAVAGWFGQLSFVSTLVDWIR
jgi:hypothetical protein